MKCAVGFAAIGSGVGSLIGTYVGGVVWKRMTVEDQLARNSTIVTYEWLWNGVAIGVMLGGLAGVLYAMRKRPRSNRHHTPSLPAA